MPKEKGQKMVAQNKKARHDYHIEDTWEAGLVLVCLLYTSPSPRDS